MSEDAGELRYANELPEITRTKTSQGDGAVSSYSYIHIKHVVDVDGQNGANLILKDVVQDERELFLL